MSTCTGPPEPGTPVTSVRYDKTTPTKQVTTGRVAADRPVCHVSCMSRACQGQVSRMSDGCPERVPGGAACLMSLAGESSGCAKSASERDHRRGPRRSRLVVQPAARPCLQDQLSRKDHPRILYELGRHR